MAPLPTRYPPRRGASRERQAEDVASPAPNPALAPAVAPSRCHPQEATPVGTSVFAPVTTESPELLELLQMMPVPELLNMRRILCVQPHPDDMEVAAGGTIARLVRSGAVVIYVTVTDGGLGSSDPRDKRQAVRERRRREQEAAARILGVAKLRWLDFPDGGQYAEDEVRARILAEIRRFQP